MFLHSFSYGKIYETALALRAAFCGDLPQAVVAEAAAAFLLLHRSESGHFLLLFMKAIFIFLFHSKIKSNVLSLLLLQKTWLI